MTVIDFSAVENFVTDMQNVVIEWLNKEARDCFSDEVKANIQEKTGTIIEDAHYSCLIEIEDEDDSDETEGEGSESKDWFERIWSDGEFWFDGEGTVDFEGFDLDLEILIDDIFKCIAEESNNCAIPQDKKERLVRAIKGVINEEYKVINQLDIWYSYA